MNQSICSLLGTSPKTIRKMIEILLVAGAGRGTITNSLSHTQARKSSTRNSQGSEENTKPSRSIPRRRRRGEGGRGKKKTGGSQSQSPALTHSQPLHPLSLCNNLGEKQARKKAKQACRCRGKAMEKVRERRGQPEPALPFAFAAPAPS